MMNQLNCNHIDAGAGLPARAELLLKWYDRNARILPWRERPDPYWIWVSEIMLQQTRVRSALPYFQRFVEAFPDIPSLARAEESLLLKAWEGLGYYSRVRNLQKAARVVVERHGGRLPASYQELMALPGIGEYTAGAIASMAFRIPVPAVDGNVLRVMARLLGCREDIARPEVKRRLRAEAEKWLPAERPGDFNQAMMDLGATVCLPNTPPHCSLCPLSRLCAGWREGVSAELPVKSPPKPRDVQKKTVLLLIAGGSVLLHRRPQTGLLAGLWEFPNVEGWLDEKAAAMQLEEWGANPLKIVRIQDSRHIFSHREWHMRGYRIYTEDPFPCPGGQWADGEAVEKEYALPSAFRYFTRNLAQWIR